MVSSLLVLVLVQVPEASSPPTPAQVRTAVERSVAYLQEEAIDWIHNRKCASCHHAPMAIWALNEARRRGFSVDQAALDELVSWTLDDVSRSKLLLAAPKPDEKAGPGDLSTISNAYGLLAAAALAPSELSEPARTGVKQLRASIREKQQPDGSFVHGGGRPPMLESREIATLMALLALASPGEAGEPAESEVRKRAADWVRQSAPGSGLQARVLRLFVAVRSQSGREAWAADVEWLLGQQRSDGGWSQTPEMASDAFATGQALFVLSLAGLEPDNPAAARARAFLVSTQKEDGDWPMTSRPAVQGGSPAKDLRPITAAATAWAALGLIRAMPD